MLELKQNQYKLTEEIIQIVSDYYEVNLYEDTNRREISQARVTAVYLVRKLTTIVSLEYLSRKFNRVHSTYVTLLKRLNEQLPYDKQRRNELKELELIIKTTSKYKEKSSKDKIIIQVLTKLDTMNITQLKHFLKQTEDYLENLSVEYELIK